MYNSDIDGSLTEIDNLFDGATYDGIDGITYDLMDSFLPYSDISFWQQIASISGAPILELGCGTGRVSIPLSEAGYDVYGMDLSSSMLNQAMNKSNLVKWINGDIRAFELPIKFNLIILPYNSLYHLIDYNDVITCFSCVRKHLTNSGSFVIDVFNPCTEKNIVKLFSKEPSFECEYYDARYKSFVKVIRKSYFESKIQVIFQKRIFNFIDIKKYYIQHRKLRVFFPQELKLLLDISGLTISKIFGDYSTTDFSDNSLQQIIFSHKSGHEV